MSLSSHLRLPSLELPPIPPSIRPLAQKIIDGVYNLLHRKNPYTAPELDLQTESFEDQVAEVLTLHTGQSRPTGYQRLEAKIEPLAKACMDHLSSNEAFDRILNGARSSYTETYGPLDHSVFFHNPKLIAEIAKSVGNELMSLDTLSNRDLNQLYSFLVIAIGSIVSQFWTCLRSYYFSFAEVPNTDHLEAWKPYIARHQQFRGNHPADIAFGSAKSVGLSLGPIVLFDEKRVPKEFDPHWQASIIKQIDQALRTSFFLRERSKKAKCPAAKQIPRLVDLILEIMLSFYDEAYMELGGSSMDGDLLDEQYERALYFMENEAATEADWQESLMVDQVLNSLPADVFQAIRDEAERRASQDD